MKKYRYFLLGLAVLITAAAILSSEVTTRQGVDYKVRTIKIPLYLKLLDFYDRHYNYMLLAKRITSGAKTEEQKAMKIFEWTYGNIKKKPEGFPIIDDHAWHIIIRGYGVEDQFSDVFATLCNYAGLDASYLVVYSTGRGRAMTLSFVKTGGKWHVFDPCRGVYFVGKNGGFEDIRAMRSGEWIAQYLDNKEVIDYKEFLDNLPIPKNGALGRPNVQSPVKRLLYEINKRCYNTKR